MWPRRECNEQGITHLSPARSQLIASAMATELSLRNVPSLAFLERVCQKQTLLFVLNNNALKNGSQARAGSKYGSCCQVPNAEACCTTRPCCGRTRKIAQGGLACFSGVACKKHRTSGHTASRETLTLQGFITKNESVTRFSSSKTCSRSLGCTGWR